MTELLSFNEENFQFAWDATSISAFEKCPRYYYLRHIEGWQSRGTNPHLFFGGCYASALESFEKYVALGDTRDEALVKVVREALIATWFYDKDDEGGTIAGTGEPWESEHNTKTRETLIRTIVWYVDHFADDPAPVVMLDDDTPAVEHSFSLPLNDDFLYCGHLDKLVQYSGGTYVMDQKTTGATVTPYFFDQFKPDAQMGGYTWAGKIIFNLPVAGVIIDAAQIAVGFTRFSRGFVPYSEQLLEEWYQETLNTISEAKRAHEENHYPMRRSSCGNYGGCAFRKVCSRIPEHRSKVLEANFTRAPRWDPLQRR